VDHRSAVRLHFADGSLYNRSIASIGPTIPMTRAWVQKTLSRKYTVTDLHPKYIRYLEDIPKASSCFHTRAFIRNRTFITYSSTKFMLVHGTVPRSILFTARR